MGVPTSGVLWATWRKRTMHRIAIFALLLPCVVIGTAFAGFDEGRSALESGDYATALIELQPLADQGHSGAQVLLGEMYLIGMGTPQDDQRALEWFRKAAAQGEAIAQNNLGVMYQGGRAALPPDDRQAVEWYRKAAAQGYAPAQYNLGNMLLNGNGVPQDDAQAIAWFRKAAELGYPPAQHDLGNAYLNGRGVSQDDGQAIAWYRKAAAQGYASAQHNLGVSYFNGRGVPQDDQQAVQWYRKAALQGFGASQNNLGVLYQGGRGGLPQDDRQAAEWYRKAAEQGIADAQVNLGNLYFSGRGVPRDDVLAYMLFNLAASSGDKTAASNRANMAQSLSLKQMEKAIELGKTWRPGTPLPTQSESVSK